MDEWGVRTRGVLDEWFAVAVVVLLVVAGAGAYLTYGAYAAPGTHTEERTVGSWESTASFDHSATVVNGTEVFAEGDTVSNRSVYFRRVMPILDGAFTYGYRATGDGALETTVETRLVIRSISDERGSDEESTTFYHAGDTSLMVEMREVTGPYLEPDAAALPVGDHFTMGPVQAAIAVDWLDVDHAFPMHYDTFPPIEQDPEEFASEVRATGSDAEVHALAGDESFTLADDPSAQS